MSHFFNSTAKRQWLVTRAKEIFFLYPGLSSKIRSRNRRCHTLHSWTGGECEGLQKKLGKTHSKNIRGWSSCLSEMSRRHAHHQLHRRPAGHPILSHLGLWLIRSRPPPKIHDPPNREYAIADLQLQPHSTLSTATRNIHGTIISSHNVLRLFQESFKSRRRGLSESRLNWPSWCLNRPKGE